MDALGSALSRGTKLAYERIFARRIAINLKRPIYTFTFDDVPASAMTNGVPILESVGVLATFYVAGKFGEKGEGDRFLCLDAVAQLHQSGHHIGCHTYTHYRLSDGSAREMCWDALQNRLVLGETLGGAPIEHFSYPFGRLTLSTKRLLNREYKTLRGNRTGINHGVVDLTFLRSTKLYSKTLDRKHIREIISNNANLSGWLIFYTHGVDAEPTPWDITPEDLRWVVDECVRTRGEILNIRDAYQKVNHNK